MMNSADKILQSINADTDKCIEEIKNKTLKDCEKILSKGKKEAEAVTAETEAKAKQRASQMQAASKSRCDLEKRNALLKRRRLEIDKTLNMVKDYITKLDDGMYFDFIYRLLKGLKGKYINPVILLNQRDIDRLPTDFEKKAKALFEGVEVSKIPVDIDGGFILKCGDIEENMSIASLLSANREKAEDLINRELFKA